MICHDLRYIFIHQRKCAGTSIGNALKINPLCPDWHFANDGGLCPRRHEWPKSYLVFAVVRNPWDRFISGWRYLEATKNRSVRDVLGYLPQEGHDYRHLTRPQSATLFDSSGAPVFDHLLRFETLQRDFDSMCDMIGYPRTVLPWWKKTDRQHYSIYFDRETASIVGRHFREDVERFEYSF